MADYRRLCLYMPYFATDRARRDADWLTGDRRAALALTRAVGSSLVVEHLDARAEQLGLRAGISLGQAQAVVPALVALSHQPQRDREALRQLADWAIRFSPLVEAVEPDTLLIDITGCQRLFRGEPNLAQQAVAGLRRQGFFARAAIAETVGAACALAFSPAGSLCHSGSRCHTEDFCQIVPPGQTSAYLAPLPPRALRIGPRVSARLEALGVRTIGDVLRLPRASLPARFGSQLVLRLQQALGEVFEGVAAREPEKMPRARLDFEQPVCELPLIQPVVQRLLAELFEQLQRQDLALRRLDCVLCFERTPPTTLSLGLSRPSRSAGHVRTLLEQRLEPLDLSVGVCGLLLVARETARWRSGQADLFEPGEPEEAEELGSLIDRLAGRLGDDAVLRAQLVDDYQPEMAFRYVSLANTAYVAVGSPGNRCGGCPTPSRGGGLSQVPKAVRPPPSERMGHPCPRPVQLLPRPIPVRVIALVPDGPPTWFAYRGQGYVVAAAEGPERLETAWWRGPDVRRDYFRVTAESGTQFWIFHAFDEGRWYLHGIFA